MKKSRRIALIVAQVLTLIETLVMVWMFFMWGLVGVAFGGSLFVVRVSFLSVFFCVLMIPFVIAGLIQAYKAPQGCFKKGSAILSSAFNGLCILIVLVFIFLQNSYGLPFVFLELLLGFYVASEFLLILGLKKVSKESIEIVGESPRSDIHLSSQLAKEKEACTLALCELWKLYEQNLISEEEYTKKKQAIFDRGFFR